jgi:hypothetical protein
MEETLNEMLLRTLPDVPKKPRPSNRAATKLVKNSVRGRKTKITGEQGFRNYLKYTDPLLQESDETTDKSKLADDMEKILNMIAPSGNIDKTAEIYLRNEPVENADALSEISAQPLSKYVKQKRNEEQAAEKIENFLEKSVKTKREAQKKNKSAVVIQSAVRGKKARDELKKEKEEAEMSKSATVLQNALKGKKARDEMNKRRKISTGSQTTDTNYIKTEGDKKATREVSTPIKGTKTTSQGTLAPVFKPDGDIDGRSMRDGKEVSVSKTSWEKANKPSAPKKTQKSTSKKKTTKKKK